MVHYSRNIPKNTKCEYKYIYMHSGNDTQITTDGHEKKRNHKCWNVNFTLLPHKVAINDDVLVMCCVLMPQFKFIMAVSKGSLRSLLEYQWSMRHLYVYMAHGL